MQPPLVGRGDVVSPFRGADRARGMDRALRLRLRLRLPVLRRLLLAGDGGATAVCDLNRGDLGSSSSYSSSSSSSPSRSSFTSSSSSSSSSPPSSPPSSLSAEAKLLPGSDETRRLTQTMSRGVTATTSSASSTPTPQWSTAFPRNVEIQSCSRGYHRQEGPSWKKKER